MRFRLGLAAGFASGYYLGARAGRQRYDQINRSLERLRRSEAFETAADAARTAIGDGVDKARSLVEEARDEAKPEPDVPTNGQDSASAGEVGIIVPGRPDPPA